MDSTSAKDSQKSGSPLEYPPCKVCGGTGAGKHYGVHTCQSCKDKMQLTTAAIGPIGVMTNEEYINFFSTTGFDIEGRSKQLRRFTSQVAPFLRRILKFAHKIPGFKSLIPKDRASLIKASKSEVQVLMLNRAVDPDLEMWMVWCGDVLDVNRSWMFGSIENRKKWFSLAKETRDLNLSTEEMAVVMGMSMTFTDRCSLHQPVEVDKINLNLTSYLQTLLQRRYKDTANNQLCKIMKLFVNLSYKTVEEKLFQQIAGIPMGTNCAPLLADIFLYSYEAEFIQSLVSEGKRYLASDFSFTYRYIDDVFSINNPKFADYLSSIYPSELEVKETTEHPIWT
ncbi:hypothetical protein FSP39_011878 [Pinctada imbricata]|uniref:NR LBD domain-containing protein n=1 Tax=Pinctada imbricata TaxID=66713 RepID=A0AA89C688_PINIB|nr:hypothetical protein FSP39_011878 [Pinctada imbricata]